jgi:predicted aminopeptidase
LALYIKHFLLTVIVITCFTHAAFISYAVKQLKGQLYILLNTQKIDTSFLHTLDADKRQKIEFINAVKKFAVDSLGFACDKQYTTFYNQENKPILFVVNAAYAFELKAFLWNFPFLGKVPYKGFFNLNDAKAEVENLNQSGFDTRIVEINAWSTLGILSDPILSDFLNLDYGVLAELIFHELTHAEVYIPNQPTFNENLATFIGQKATLQFLHQVRYQKFLANYKNHLYDEQLFEAYNQFATKYLKTNYQEMALYPKNLKIKTKQKHLQFLLQTKQLLPFKTFKPKYKLPNNTQFVAMQTYYSMQPIFEKKFSMSGYNLMQFINCYR